MGTTIALRAHAHGGPEQLVYEQAPAPTAGLGEALIAGSGSGGAAGGVGIFAVQLAVILGGHVTATGHGTDAGLVRDLGAERLINAEAGRPGQAAAGIPSWRERMRGAGRTA